ncbi:hypothetical protein HK405_015352 [Cladochytrium tenue]|nr:hypothetical protein HK405_015352 [Cladochytrium tenue]
MAKAIIGGLLAAGFPAVNIFVSEPFPAAVEQLKATYPGIRVGSDNAEAVAFGPAASPAADVVLFAVKPQVIRAVAEALAPAVQRHRPLVITIAAGIRVADLAKWLQADAVTHAPLPDAVPPHIVRVMPNTPALVSEGASGLYAGPGLPADLRTVARGIIDSFSKVAYWVEKEGLLDVVTGVSGSGPAYFFYLLEAMEEAGVELGLPREVARGLAAQTCAGAGRMAVARLEDPADLRRSVTSPNGTTHAGVQVMEHAGARAVFVDVVRAATRRAEELADTMAQ